MLSLYLCSFFTEGCAGRLKRGQLLGIRGAPASSTADVDSDPSFGGVPPVQQRFLPTLCRVDDRTWGVGPNAIDPTTGSPCAASQPTPSWPTANLRTKFLDFTGFDSSRMLTLRVGILVPVGDFPESLSQPILAGIILAGRLDPFSKSLRFAPWPLKALRNPTLFISTLK